MISIDQLRDCDPGRIEMVYSIFYEKTWH
jgi:hypothetical protein